MDKIFIFGDSIAYGKWDSEGGWVARVRKYVDQKYNIGKSGGRQVYNLGIPGEVAVRMVDRVESEMVPRIDAGKSTAVIFAIGINDSCPNNWMTQKQTPVNEFKAALVRVIEVAKKHECKITFIGLIPVNPETSLGFDFTNEAAKQYDTYISEVCVLQQVDKLNMFDDLMTPSFLGLLAESVHPNDEGHRIMADKIIAFLEERGIV